MLYELVAPHVGAWIEMENDRTTLGNYKVAPHVGAWIEIAKGDGVVYYGGRTPRGCVD